MTTCKVCGNYSINFATIPSTKSCNNVITPKSANELTFIRYVKCIHCGFIHAPYFDTWTKEDFNKNIYNDDYLLVDPEYDGTRSLRDADYFERVFPDKTLSILDFGAGNQVFGDTLTQHGYTNVESYDPMWGALPHWPVNHRFDVITAFEVFEHTPTPVDTLEEMVSYLKPTTGKILISTMVNNNEPPTCWYLSPRNGHICMHSYDSLSILFKKFGMKVQHNGNSVHLATF